MSSDNYAGGIYSLTITKCSFTVSQDSAPTVLHEIKIMIMEATIMNDVLNAMVPYPMVPKFMMDLSHAVDKVGGVAESFGLAGGLETYYRLVLKYE